MRAGLEPGPSRKTGTPGLFYTQPLLRAFLLVPSESITEKVNSWAPAGYTRLASGEGVGPARARGGRLSVLPARRSPTRVGRL